MREVVSTVSSKGEVTIPLQVREHLGVVDGGELTFLIADDGRVELKATVYPNVASLAGAAGTLPGPLSWKEMRAIAYEDRFEEKRRREI